MHTRFAGVLIAALAFLLVFGISCHRVSAASWNKRISAPAFLSLGYLHGSMQGKSGVVLDLNGDGN